MTADARSLPMEVGDTFDFDSQAGILFVLRAIRAADVSSADKNALKDLVFLYSTSGKDEATKKKLADTLALHKITPQTVQNEVKISAPVETQTVQSTSPTTGFMGGRLTPVFIPPQVSVEVKAPVAVPAPAPVVNTVVPPVIAPAPTVSDVPKPASVAPVVAPAEKIAPVIPNVRPVVSIPTPQPEVKVVQSVQSVQPAEPVANNIELSKKADSTTDVPAEYAAARMERIRVIKSDVNARVGNPVNLVDVDNVLGREYMSALLEAMKLLSSASEQESIVAMQRLETVYQQVVALLDTKKDQVIPVTPVAPVTTATPIATIPVAVAPVMPVTPVAPVSVAPVAVPVQVQAPAPEIIAPVVSIPVISVPVTVPTPAPVMTSPVEQVSDFAVRSKVSEKTNVPVAKSGWDTQNDNSVSGTVDVVSSVGSVVAPTDSVTVARMSTPPAEPLREVVAPVTPAYTPEVTRSVSEVEPLRAITELPTADEVSAIEAMSSNPLYTKDVDAGLDQLLGEWAIFKKSGLFGTGPKGREHPLYIKISGMQVPLILSGRFEGSTQEIKQSVTDYMNGWRYEQGIIYEANETFDQYLRRVIRHIIDLQKTKRRS